MNNTLIIVGHPTYESSFTTKTITEFLNATPEFLTGSLKIRNLISLYPDYKIDIDAEQDALSWADVVVLQFPFYWYSVPAILKLWMDEVFSYGFAYGKTGNKMNGKKLLLSFSTGGPQEAYAAGARNNFNIEELLFPIKQTSNLMGTQWENPLVSFGMVNISGIESDKTVTVEKAKLHALKLYELCQKA
ncbi:MAG: hypothetical protein AUK44_00120 [Porphyromonadaceae bacterium CG2_30_38_12]|nr:MAG: hypothetical protein AUK44_00120 [Porphyromonadaceae bacterium CG2_30_38_12]